MKKIKCRVCKKRIKLDKAIFYPVLKSSFVGKKEFWECFDCPRCGCQNIAGIRYGFEDQIEQKRRSKSNVI